MQYMECGEYGKRGHSPHFPHSTHSPVPLFLAGALTAGAALLKFSAALPVLPFLALAFWRGTRRTWLVLLFALGAAAPVAGAAAWLVGGGGWESYLEIQRGFVGPYARSLAGGLVHRATGLVWNTGCWIGQIWLPAALAAAAVLSGESRKQWGVRVALGAILAGMAAVWVQNKYFSYHWQSTLPFLALLAAAGSLKVASRLKPPARGLAVLTPALVWGLTGQWSHYQALPGHLAAGSREAWLARFGRPGRGDYSFLSTSQAARYAAEHTAPQDSVLVWGFEPTVYLLSSRYPSTRFFFALPVTSPLSPPAWREEFLTAIQRRPPELFLVVHNDAVPWASGTTEDSSAQLRSWPQLSTWLTTHYRPETQIEDFTVYRRRREVAANERE